MDREEALKRTDHYRCRRCGQLSPITETLCTKPGCRAQLAIYGELIAGENGASQKPETGASEETEKKKYKAPEGKPVREKKPHRQKQHKQKPAAQVQTSASFLQKKTLLTWLDVVFLLVCGLLFFCCEQVSRRPSVDEVIICIAIMLAVTIPAIVLARKERYILHGMVCILGGAAAFVVAGAVLEAANDTEYMYLAMVAAYWWLGILSFSGISRKRKALAAEGMAPPFLKKKTVILLLDIVILLVICGALGCFRTGLQHFLRNGRFRLYLDDCLIACGLRTAVAVPAIVLTSKEKYALHGSFLCVTGAVSAVLILAYSSHMLYVLIGVGIGLLHIWLGALSFVKEK